MFDALSEKLQATLSDVRARGTLTEDDITAAMREIRLALLEADVNFKVVKQFTSAVKERALGEEVVGQLNPGQQVVKIVAEELTTLMGGESERAEFAPRPPTVILMAGLQGSGKTTATAKLARHLKTEHGSSVALAACDVYRPAAVDQLVKVGGQVDAEVYEQGTDRDPVDIARWALDRAKMDGKDVLIVDTSGRLHVDQELMAELVKIHDATKPTTTLLVVDAMTGQDAVNVAEQFAAGSGLRRRGHVQARRRRPRRRRAVGQGGHRQADPLRLHGREARPVRALPPRPHGPADPRHGRRPVASSSVPRPRSTRTRPRRSSASCAATQFTLEDFLDQMKTIRRMGPLSSLLGMLPGFQGQELSQNLKVDERELDRLEAIILSMTPEERRRPS